MDRVLLDYDGPRLLLRRSDAGQYYLAWWSDTEGSLDRWIYLPLSLSRLHNVLSGSLPTLDALNAPEDGYLLVVDEDSQRGHILEVYLTDTEFIPSAALPLSGARLNLNMPDDIVTVPMRDRTHVLDIGLEPAPEDAGRVESRVLGQFIGNLQRLLNALGQAAGGNPTSRDTIPAEILQQTRLDVVATYVGSFGIRLETHTQDDVLGESVGRTAIASLFELMDAGSDLEKLTSQLERLRGRVARNYDDFLGTIETSLPSVTLRWAQGWQPDYRQFLFTRQSAGQIRARVQEVQTSIEETFSITGNLLMVSLLSRRFEIAHGESGDRIAGRIGEGAESQIRSVALGAWCQAELSPEIEVSTATGEQQTRYTLLQIRSLTNQPETQPRES